MTNFWKQKTETEKKMIFKLKLYKLSYLHIFVVCKLEYTRLKLCLFFLLLGDTQICIIDFSSLLFFVYFVEREKNSYRKICINK